MIGVGGTSGKEPPANAGDIKDISSIPGLGRSPGEGHGNTLSIFFFYSFILTVH